MLVFSGPWGTGGGMARTYRVITPIRRPGSAMLKLLRDGGQAMKQQIADRCCCTAGRFLWVSLRAFHRDGEAGDGDGAEDAEGDVLGVGHLPQRTVSNAFGQQLFDRLVERAAQRFGEVWQPGGTTQ